MRKVTGLFLILLMCGATTFAQDNTSSQRRERPPRAERDSTRRAGRVAALELDATQTAKLQEINSAYQEKLKVERDALRAEREKQQTRLSALRTERNEEIKKILSETQYDSYIKRQSFQTRRGDSDSKKPQPMSKNRNRRGDNRRS